MAKLTVPLSESFFAELESRGLTEARVVLGVVSNKSMSGMCDYSFTLTAWDPKPDVIIEAKRVFYWGPASADVEGDPFYPEYKKGFDSLDEWLKKMKEKHPSIAVKDGHWVE